LVVGRVAVRRLPSLVRRHSRGENRRGRTGEGACPYVDMNDTNWLTDFVRADVSFQSADGEQQYLEHRGEC
jgi:hypothetical protein